MRCRGFAAQASDPACDNGRRRRARSGGRLLTAIGHEQPDGRFAQFSAVEDGGQGQDRTVDLPLFKRISRSTRVHQRPPERVKRLVRAPWRPPSSHLSTAVVSTALQLASSSRRGANRQHFGLPDLGTVVRQRKCPLASAAAGCGDCIHLVTRSLAGQCHERCLGGPAAGKLVQAAAGLSFDRAAES